MKNFLIILISIISVLTTSLAVTAKEVTHQNVVPLVNKYMINHYKNLYKGQIVPSCGKIVGLPFNIDSNNFEVKIESGLRDQFVKNTIVRVSFYVNNKFQKTVCVPVKLALYDNVWITSQPINRDDAISPANVEQAKRDISHIAPTAARIGNDLSFTRVKKSFRTGEILDHRYIEKDPIVLRNSLVAIVFKSPEVNITISGEAMQNGRIGDMVKVRSKDFKKEYMGKVVDKGTVMVSI